MRFSSALLAVYVHPTVAMCGDLLVFLLITPEHHFILFLGL